MTQIKIMLTLLVVFLLLGTSCKGQKNDNLSDDVNSKDDPAVFTVQFSPDLSSLLGDTISNIITNSDTVQAYKFEVYKNKETVLDSSGLKGYKIERKISQLIPEHVNMIKIIIADSNNYIIDDNLMKSFVPDLGFNFIEKNNNRLVLVSSITGTIQFWQDSASSITIDCSPAIEKYIELGRTLFPRSYPVSANSDINEINTVSSDSVLVVNDNEVIVERDENTHLIKEGETLKSIAKLYQGMSKKDILKLNPNIKSDADLEIGKYLKIK